LHQLVRDMATVVEQRDGEIERLQTIIKQLQRMQFGRRSERLDPDQLALGLEDLDADIARVEESRPVTSKAAEARPRRKPLPDHLEREELLLDVEGETCSGCGGALHPIGESVSEMLDWVPARLRVLRIRRPKSAAPARGSTRCTNGWANTSSRPIICAPTTRRSQCSIRGGVVRKPGGSGSTPAISEAGPAPRRRAQFTSTSPIAGPNGLRPIWNTLKAFCTSMAMPGSSA
jgi:hypothetical protein